MAFGMSANASLTSVLPKSSVWVTRSVAAISSNSVVIGNAVILASQQPLKGAPHQKKRYPSGNSHNKASYNVFHDDELGAFALNKRAERSAEGSHRQPRRLHLAKPPERVATQPGTAGGSIVDGNHAPALSTFPDGAGNRVCGCRAQAR